jgi:hypothetical protein
MSITTWEEIEDADNALRTYIENIHGRLLNEHTSQAALRLLKAADLRWPETRSKIVLLHKLTSVIKDGKIPCDKTVGICLRLLEQAERKQ